MKIKDLLFSLCEASGAGYVHTAADVAFENLSRYCDCERLGGLAVVGRMKGNSDKTLMIEAHIDEVSMIVTNIDDEGFVTVSNCGGIDVRGLAARVVTIHGKSDIPAVFCSTPPHLSKGETQYGDIADIKLDTLLGKDARDIVSEGDIVTFRTSPCGLLGDRITAKSLDNRAGVCCAIELASRLKGKELPMNVVFLLSDAEELGLRGARTASFALSPDEAVVIDVTFGSAPDVSLSESGKLRGGAMIGFSPVLDSGISGRLKEIAAENGIAFQCEVMGRSTGTNADVVSLNREGVRTGLISIPLRNMHTDSEVIDLGDISCVCDILERFILSGGAPA